MARVAVLFSVLTAIAVGLMGCGGGGGGGGGDAPTPAPPATPTPAPTPAGPPPTTTTTEPSPENIPNPFCGSSDALSTPSAEIPPVGQPIGWNPTGEHVGPNDWCQAEVPAKDFNLKNYCGTGNLQASAAAGPEVKVLSYNLYWWNLYGQRHGNQNSAGKNMANFAKDKPYDLFGFQECEDINLVTQGMKDAGITTNYETLAIGEGYVNVCMGFATDVFQKISSGRAFVAEDQQGNFHYGKRVVQWMRLKHKSSGKMVFFINHHGPTPPNTGGMCGSKATAYQLVKAIAQNAHVGDSVIFIGDFNAPMQMNMGKGNEWQEEAGVIDCHIPHVFAVPTPEAMWGVDNFYSTCTNLKESTKMERGGSDHFALNAVFELTGPSAAAMESTELV